MAGLIRVMQRWSIGHSRSRHGRQKARAATMAGAWASGGRERRRPTLVGRPEHGHHRRADGAGQCMAPSRSRRRRGSGQHGRQFRQAGPARQVGQPRLDGRRAGARQSRRRSRHRPGCRRGPPRRAPPAAAPPAPRSAPAATAWRCRRRRPAPGRRSARRAARRRGSRAAAAARGTGHWPPRARRRSPGSTPPGGGGDPATHGARQQRAPKVGGGPSARARRRVAASTPTRTSWAAARRRRTTRGGGIGFLRPVERAPPGTRRQGEHVVDARGHREQGRHRRATADRQPRRRKVPAQVGDCRQRHDGVTEPVRRQHEQVHGRGAPIATAGASTATGRDGGARTSRGRRCSAA